MLASRRVMKTRVPVAIGRVNNPRNEWRFIDEFGWTRPYRARR